MAVPFPDRWRDLKRILDGDRPADATLYIQPPRSLATDIAEEIRSDPAACSKYLLIGPRGGGKSTELREIGRQLSEDLELVELDLDRSGISAASVTAADLLYLCGVGLLRKVPHAKANPLFTRLKKAYTGSDGADAKLGSLADAPAGLAGFSSAAGTAAVAAGGTAGGGPMVGAALGAASIGVRLMAGRPGVVPETSPTGRALEQAVEEITEAARSATDRRGICVLVDGLEKMNGEAGERFRQVFQQTRLLADARWCAVYAAPRPPP